MKIDLTMTAKKNETEILTEITPLSDKDCFYLVDRDKERFTYPIHRHDDFELNLVLNAAGASRVVGDSICEISDIDLVLAGHGIEHVWEQGKCESHDIREITLQFSERLFGDTFLGKSQLAAIRDMLERSSFGIAFSEETALRAKEMLIKMTSPEVDDFRKLLMLLSLLNDLATSGSQTLLASSTFAKVSPTVDSRRILKVQSYIKEHYREEISLNTLADIAGMTPSSFSRFFKMRTGRKVSDYITDIKLGHATRALVDCTHSIAEICYDCGFNNVSYFNRIFKKKKHCSPKEFRELYKRNRTLV